MGNCPQDLLEWAMSFAPDGFPIRPHRTVTTELRCFSCQNEIRWSIPDGFPLCSFGIVSIQRPRNFISQSPKAPQLCCQWFWKPPAPKLQVTSYSWQAQGFQVCWRPNWWSHEQGTTSVLQMDFLFTFMFSPLFPDSKPQELVAFLFSFVIKNKTQIKIPLNGPGVIHPWEGTKKPRGRRGKLSASHNFL